LKIILIYRIKRIFCELGAATNSYFSIDLTDVAILSTNGANPATGVQSPYK